MSDPNEPPEELLPEGCITAAIDQPRLEELLLQLKFVAQLLAETSGTVSGPALIYRHPKEGNVVAHCFNRRTTVGRVPGCDLVLGDLPGVSRVHFEIVENEGDYILIDAESKNGTYLNGSAERISRHCLRNGDLISAAGIAFAFVRS